MIRILLPRDATNVDIGIYAEQDAETLSKSDTVLVPPDETWQGGIMQLFRAAVPTCEDIIKNAFTGTAGLPPRINEDRSIDESGVDGVTLLTTSTPEKAISCVVQPLQESIDFIEKMVKKQEGQTLTMLVNPQWRSVDDALDSASHNDGFLGSLASFLGGKGGALKRLDEMKFQFVYVIEGYVCKGGNIRLLKRFDSDWTVFAEKDNGLGYIKLGTSEMRPTYQECENMMDQMGISLKYARDIGLAPKL